MPGRGMGASGRGTTGIGVDGEDFSTKNYGPVVRYIKAAVQEEEARQQQAAQEEQQLLQKINNDNTKGSGSVVRAIKAALREQEEARQQQAAQEQQQEQQHAALVAQLQQQVQDLKAALQQQQRHAQERLAEEVVQGMTREWQLNGTIASLQISCRALQEETAALKQDRDFWQVHAANVQQQLNQVNVFYTNTLQLAIDSLAAQKAAEDALEVEQFYATELVQQLQHDVRDVVAKLPFKEQQRRAHVERFAREVEEMPNLNSSCFVEDV